MPLLTEGTNAVNRVRLLLALLVLIAVLVISACSPSPKSRVDDFVQLMPEEVGPWETDKDDVVQLGNNTVTSTGHATLIYEGPDDALAYVVIEAHPSEDAAEVAATRRERELLLQELTLDTDRDPVRANAEVTQAGRVRYALFHEETIIVEIDALAADGEDPVSDEDFGALIEIVRVIFEQVLED